jgi:ribose transport system substrate-binding protein
MRIERRRAGQGGNTCLPARPSAVLQWFTAGLLQRFPPWRNPSANRHNTTLPQQRSVEITFVQETSKNTLGRTRCHRTLIRLRFLLKTKPARGTLLRSMDISTQALMNRTIRLSPLAITTAACLLATWLLPGCKPADEGKSAAPPKPRVALVMKSLANEFFLTMESGAKAHQQAHSGEYALLANGIKDELDVSRQIDLVEQMVAQNVDAIVIAPADSKALVPVCKKAQQAGITVVNIDNKLDDTVLAASGVKFPFVGPDNRKGAKAVGDFLAQKLKAGDKVAIVEGAPNAFNGIQRKLGFTDAMKAAGMNIVSSQSGYWEAEKANQVVAALLTEYPDLKAVLCANDSMALGAVAALRGAGKLDQVLVVGFDNIAAAQQLLKEGKLLATADQHADQLAVFGIEYALDMLRNKTTPADHETPVGLVTAESLSGKKLP